MKSLVLVAAACILLAGCSGGKDANSSSTGPGNGGSTSNPVTATGTSPAGTSGASSSSSGSGTTSTGAGVNTPPTATLVASSANGVAPFNVTFTLDAADQDGDDMSYSFDANDDATLEAQSASPADLPRDVSFVFAGAGTYNATFTVSDGKDSTVANVHITVTAAAGSGGPAPSITLSGSYVMPDPVELGLAGFGCALGGDPSGQDVWGNVVTVPPEALGGTYTATASGPTNFYFEDVNFAVLNDGGSTGTVPSDTDALYVCASAPTSVMVDWTMEITPP
jgi:hypothetical protein